MWAWIATSGRATPQARIRNLTTNTLRYMLRLPCRQTKRDVSLNCQLSCSPTWPYTPESGATFDIALLISRRLEQVDSAASRWQRHVCCSSRPMHATGTTSPRRTEFLNTGAPCATLPAGPAHGQHPHPIHLRQLLWTVHDKRRSERDEARGRQGRTRAVSRFASGEACLRSVQLIAVCPMLPSYLCSHMFVV
jgi:hypothetical protein